MNVKDRVLDALRAVPHPLAGTDMVSAGAVQSVQLNGDNAVVTLCIDPSAAQKMEPARQACERAALSVDGVSKAQVIMTAQRPPSGPGAGAGAGPGAGASGARPGGAPPPPPKPKPLKGVKYVIAVASGKGGVGKSTTSINLAYALQSLGLRVGLADCDVYGPSAAMLMGLRTGPQFTDDDRILPVEQDGLSAISMSFLVDPDTAAIWRGPMVIGAIQQFFTGVAWDHAGPLDVVIADMPPGTGDVQLTLVQTVEVAGAVIVSTPQDLALIDARKAFDMFAKTGVPVLGVVENMSHFVCPHCGGRSEIFGHGGAAATAQAKGVPFLGEIPLELAIRETSDAGAPIVLSAPDSPSAQAYKDIAAKVVKALMKT